MPFASFNTKHAPATPPEIAARDTARQADLAATLSAPYPQAASIVLELGCGHGHFLAAYAAAHPKALCLGVDLVSKRIERAQRKQQRGSLTNLAFFKADATETLTALPPYTRLAGIFVLFPDPWPKRRYHSRRLLQTDLLDALAARSSATTWLAVRSDELDYLTWAENQIKNHSQWQLTPEVAWPFEHASVFQEMQGSYKSLMANKK